MSLTPNRQYGLMRSVRVDPVLFADANTMAKADGIITREWIEAAICLALSQREQVKETAKNQRISRETKGRRG